MWVACYKAIVIFSLQALTLNEALNIDSANARMESSYRPQSSESSRHSTIDDNDQQERLPASYNMAAPMNDAELVALLMASPLYQKLENIKSQIEKGAHKANKTDTKDGNYLNCSLLLNVKYCELGIYLMCNYFSWILYVNPRIQMSRNIGFKYM